MNTTFLPSIAIMAFSYTVAVAAPRPDFIPPTPPVSKAIAQYTVADVMGIIATKIEQLPSNHPYVVNKKYDDEIKSSWPGAKISTNIDAMMQIVLNAPPPTDLESPLRKNISGAWASVEVFIYNIMDIPDNEKVDAILRTVNAQTDVFLKKRAITFAVTQFPSLLDPRLLSLYLPDLESSKVLTSHYRNIETRPPETYSVRGLAKDNILTWLDEVFEFDRSPFEVADEAAACAALKAWWTQNYPLITTKCAEKKASPEWTRRSFFGAAWDVKW
jgi:hypothetical protein